MKKEDFHKGQTVWIYLIGDAGRGKNTTEERIKEWEVVSVGRKYITARSKTGGREQKFNIQNDFRQVYDFGIADYELHLTKDEIYKKVEKEKRIQYIKRFCQFEGYLRRLSDEDLKDVEEILRKCVNEDRTN